jgi:O-antigen/teichoic acid export membrane protein
LTSVKNNTIVMAADKLISVLYLFLLMLLMTSSYDKSDYGEYQYALALAVIVSVVLKFSDDKVIKHYYHSAGLFQVIFSSIALKLSLSVMGIVIYYILAEFSLVTGFAKIYLFYLLSALILANILYPIVYYFDYRMDSAKRVKALISGNTAAFLLQIYFITNGYSVEYVAISVLAGAFVSNIVLLIFFLYLKLEITPVFSMGIFRSIFIRSIPLTLASAAHMIYMRTDIIMVEYFMGYSSVATYSISMQLMSLAGMLIIPLQVSFFPYLLKLKDKDSGVYYKDYQTITVIITWIGILIAIIGLVLVSPFVTLVLGDGYKEIEEFFFLHMLSVVVLYNACLRSSHITLIKRGDIILYAQLISLALNVGLNYLLIPEYGLSGAAFATLITIFISLFVSNYFHPSTRKIFQSQLKAFYPKKSQLITTFKMFKKL